VALFNVGGAVYALSNRCSHARGPLSAGVIKQEDGLCTVTCPWHYGKFDLATGHILDGVVNIPVPAYDVDIRAGVIYLREKQAEAQKEPTA
jgi:nitrite reductase/ring-hydroxylating ferredoxin subunit